MRSTFKVVACGAVLALAGSLAAATRHRDSSVPAKQAATLLLDKFKSSDSGHATATLEIFGDSADAAMSLAVFRLVAISVDNGMLTEVRRVQPLAEVTWPVTLTHSGNSGVFATAVFTSTGTLEAPLVEISTSDG